VVVGGGGGGGGGWGWGGRGGGGWGGLGVGVRMVGEPLAGDALGLALGRIVAGDFDDAATLDANYLRRTDAEIFAKAAAQRDAR